LKKCLRVNPIACDAFGYCAEILPEMVTLDEWGFPIIGADPVPPALLDLAFKAVDDCPRRALILVDEPRSTSSRASRSSTARMSREQAVSSPRDHPGVIVR
jgi:ferredoxin